MAMNRVQSQRGLSLPQFMERYGTEEQCGQAVIAARWPPGFTCPACGLRQARSTFRRQGRLYWQCADCARQCSVISGTVFESTKLPLRRWFMAMQLLTQSKNNVSALELKRQIGVCYRTAWLLKHKLLEAMRLAEADRQLTGRVEIDDAYLAEVQFRFNRRYDMPAMLGKLLGALVATPRRPERGIRVAELHR